MWGLITGCSSQPSVTEPVSAPVYAIEQNAQGHFVVCIRPCFDASEDTDLDLPMPDIKKPSLVPSTPVLHLVQFDFGEFRVTPREAESLARLAEEMKEQRPMRGFWLRGYTDDIGPSGYNLRLAEKRVAAVEEKLIELGLPVLRKEALGACCFVASNDTADDRALNRRVEVFVLNEKRAGAE